MDGEISIQDDALYIRDAYRRFYEIEDRFAQELGAATAARKVVDAIYDCVGEVERVVGRMLLDDICSQKSDGSD